MQASSLPHAWREVRLSRETLPPARLASFGQAVRSSRRAEVHAFGEDLLVGLRDEEGGGALGLWTTWLVAVDRGNGDTRNVVDVARWVGGPSATYGPAEVFLPFPLWVACPDRRIALYDPAGNRVVWLDARGDSVGARTLPRPRMVPLTPRTMAAWAYRSALTERRIRGGPPLDSAAFFREAHRALAATPAGMIASVFPEYVDLQCTTGGTLWLRRFAVSATPGDDRTRWLGLAPHGAARELVFPRTFEPMQFADRRVWGVALGELDLPAVASVMFAPRDSRAPVGNSSRGALPHPLDQPMNRRRRP